MGFSVMESVKRAARVQHYEMDRETVFVHREDGRSYRVTTFKIRPHGRGVGQWGWGYSVVKVGHGTRNYAWQRGFTSRREALSHAKSHIKAGTYG